MSTQAVEAVVRRAARSHQEGHLAEAREAAKESLTVSRETGTLVELVHMLRMLGQIELDLGQPDETLRNYQEAVDTCR